MYDMDLYGELPTKPVVYAACDSYYFISHAEAFIFSANSAKKDVHIHCINPTQEVYTMAILIANSVSVNVTYSFSDYDLSGMDDETKRTYYACARFLYLPYILQEAKNVLTLDIDCVILKDFKFPTKPIGYFPREPLQGTVGWEREGSKVAAGVLYLDRKALNVADEIAKYIRNNPLRWFVDQRAIHETLQRVSDDYKFVFDKTFMDWDFEDTSVIWTGKGNRKHTNVDYVNKKKSFEKLKEKLDDVMSVICQPLLRAPFKKTAFIRSDQHFHPIRTHWANFTQRLNEKIEKELPNYKHMIIEAPRWMFNNSLERWFDNECVFYVPHVEQHNYGGGRRTFYYMQTVFPWLFTIDPKGWGGGADFIGLYNKNYPHDNEAFEQMQKYIYSGKSKFAQPSGKWESVKNKIKENFIFVPLQLPHDETIKWHSDISVEQFVSALCEWADEDPSRPQIVFKGHPINPQSMIRLINIISSHKNVLYLTDISIHDLIPRAEATYVVNSGTGQEAMLHDAQVVVFGRCEYQNAVIQGDITDLNGTYDMIQKDSREEREKRYRHWYNWYIKKIVFDTNVGK